MQKIYTFLLKHTRKRFNVVCYSDKDLCIPIRFAKKLIKVDVDNDAESEKEMIEEEVKRGEQVLREAILVNQNSQIK